MIHSVKTKTAILLMVVVIICSISGCNTNGGQGAEFPDKDITIICATNPGGSMDAATRLLSPHLKAASGQNVPVENVVGSAGWVALSQLASSNSEGYEVCYIAFPQIIVASMDPANDIGIDIDDFTPIALDVDDNNILVANGSEDRFSNAEEFIAYAKENPILFGTCAGAFSDDNVAKTYMQQAIPGLQFETVHFTSSSEGFAAILGGHIDVLMANVSEPIANINDGKLIGIAVLADERSEFLPDVQTLTELGYPISCGSTRGYVAHGKISDDVREKLCAIFDEAMSSEAYQESLTSKYFKPYKVIGSEFEKWLDEQKSDMEQLYEMLN